MKRKRLSKIYTNKQIQRLLDKGYDVETAENMLTLADATIMFVAAQALEDGLSDEK